MTTPPEQTYQRRASDRPPGRRPLGRRSLGLLVVGAAAVILGVLVWTWAGRDWFHGDPDWSPDSQFLVFAAGRDGRTDLFVMRADGSERRQLTRTEARETGPAFSSDGLQIAFETDRHGNPDIYVMETHGAATRRLTTDPASDLAPAWLPDGQRIAFLSDRASRENFDLYVINADGSGLARVTTGGGYRAASYSPDGRHLAYESGRDLHVLDVSTGVVRQLTYAPHDGASPAWSPDGRHLAFSTTRNGRTELFTMNADGSNQRVLVSLPQGAAVSPRWSPDGRSVAFVAIEGARRQEAAGGPQALYTIDIGSGRLARLTP